MDGSNIGAVIVTGFADFWAIAGTRSLGKAGRKWTWLAALLISLGVIFAVVGHTRPVAKPADATTAFVFDGRAYWLSVAFEAVAIPLAVTILKRQSRKRYILPVIALIVGLHFFGLVRAFGSNEFWWIGGTMCALPIFAVACLPPTWTRSEEGTAAPGDLWAVVVGLGCAIILWVCAVLILL